MAAVELSERAVIAEVCRRSRFLHVYELGDLDDFFWPHTRFVGWESGKVVTEVALLYGEPDPPVLLALTEQPHGDMRDLLATLLPELPNELYVHVTPDLIPTLASRYAIRSHGVHLKMGLTHDSRLGACEAELLGPAHLDELQAFYRRAYPGTWFVPRMLETGRYVGLRDGAELACVAGVHVHSPSWRVAALGNVATLPELRGRGLAKHACGALCRLLLEDGIDTIGLNVRSDNHAAIAAYEALGFEPVATYVEARLGTAA